MVQNQQPEHGGLRRFWQGMWRGADQQPQEEVERPWYNPRKYLDPAWRWYWDGANPRNPLTWWRSWGGRFAYTGVAAVGVAAFGLFNAAQHIDDAGRHLVYGNDPVPEVRQVEPRFRFPYEPNVIVLDKRVRDGKESIDVQRTLDGFVRFPAYSIRDDPECHSPSVQLSADQYRELCKNLDIEIIIPFLSREQMDNIEARLNETHGDGLLKGYLKNTAVQVRRPEQQRSYPRSIDGARSNFDYPVTLNVRDGRIVAYVDIDHVAFVDRAYGNIGEMLPPGQRIDIPRR